jgi:beta-1,4-mannosyltransferase
MLKGSLVAVVAMGDIARSPRMLNHARELAANGFAVVIIGYRGREFALPDHARVVGLDGGHSAARGASGIRFAIRAGWRMGRLFFVLFRTLLREKPRAILVQNPPSFPTLTAATLAARCLGCKVIVDWHNYGFSLLGLRFGSQHWLVRLARWYEFRAGRMARAHLCVSRAMREDLLGWGIRAEVLYDRPLLSRRVPPLLSQRVPGLGGRFVAVCPAGWSADEDIELLLDALDLMPPAAAITVYITGDGAKRQELEPRLRALRLKGILEVPGFLPEAEYWDLIARADLGLSLHRSSSGLDLAMKVVDLFSRAVPVSALDYGGSIGEQIEDGVTGFLFQTAQDLAELLTRLESNPDTLDPIRSNIAKRWDASWSAEWQRIVLPL